MADWISNATGNFTGASTFAAAEVGTGALKGMRNSTTAIQIATGSTVNSDTFTITNGKVIDGVILWMSQDGGTNGGTVTVNLQLSGVTQVGVTVNKADLPPNQVGQTSSLTSPVFFKFTATATGDGTANWRIQVVTSASNSACNYSSYDGTAGHFTRLLRTTTAGSVAAGDNVYVVGELTGAGTHNTNTVTMDNTATTQFGSGVVASGSVYGGTLAISNFGVLSYGVAASTNYYLKFSGDVYVGGNGTFNIGKSGTEIPRTSTAVLEIVPNSANTDFGIRVLDTGTFTTAGLSRTVSKNVVSTKLTADVVNNSVLQSFSQTNTNGSTAFTSLDATGTTPLSGAFTETTANATHSTSWNGLPVTNTTQVATVWVARGSGTHNRFLRLTVGDNTVQSSVVNGFFSDIDMQLGTAGTVTAIGNGTATSVSIVADGAGWIIRMVGKCSSAAHTPSLLLNSQSAAGTNSFAGVADQAFLYDKVALVTAASLSDTTYSVADDTGWLSGDVVAVAPSTQNTIEGNLVTLNANAGASSFTSAEYPCEMLNGNYPISFTNSGTAPFATEVMLVSRNVKVRSSSITLNTWLYGTTYGSITMAWTEIYRIAAPGNANKRGIEIDATGSGTATAKSFTYCSIHESTQFGFLLAANFNGASVNTTIDHCTFWNNGSSAVDVATTLTADDWTVTNCIVLRCQATAFTFSDVGGTFTGCTVAGETSGYALTIGEGAPLGTWNNFTCHSNIGGITLTASGFSGTFSNVTIWRCSNSGTGINYGVTCPDLYWSNLTMFGNAGPAINAAASTNINVLTGAISGDTTYGTLYVVDASSAGIIVGLFFDSVDCSGVGTSLAPVANFITTAANYPVTYYGHMNNCKFGSVAVIGGRAQWSNTAFIGFEKYGQTAGDHRCEMTYGTAKTDTSIFNTASPSERLTPNNASNKCESAPKNFGLGIKVPVANGTTVTIGVSIRKSVAGDGAAYNGNQPRLIQRANSALGQNSDVVIATYSSAAGSWNAISGTSSSATDDGFWEFIVDCDGTAGWINVDDWTVSGQATTSLGLKNWLNGIPEIAAGSGGGASTSFSVGFA